MRKITEYNIVCDDDIDGIIETIDNHIKHGWQPFGGVCYDHDSFWHQAMVKYADDKHMENEK